MFVAFVQTTKWKCMDEDTGRLPQSEESINLHSKLMPRYIPLGTLTSQEAHLPATDEYT